MNPTLKHFAERALIRAGAERFTRRSMRERVLVLAYHNVLPHGEASLGDSSLHLSQHEFALQLDVLARTHEVIPIDAMSERAVPGARPRVVITFDDAYAGALAAGVEELRRRGMPATIFVAPALLGSVTWWDILAKPAGGSVPDQVRQYALEMLEGRTERILDWARSVSAETMSPSAVPRIGTESQLRLAASTPGITLGSHSWCHANLCTLSKPELEIELGRPHEWLRSRFAGVVPWLTYPYGLHNEAVRTTAAKAGYLGAFRIEGGWISRSSSFPSFALPRFNVPAGLSVDGFRLRLAGL